MSPQRAYSGSIGFYGYDALLVINCTRGRILRSLLDSLRHLQRRYCLPLLRLKNIAENFNWLSSVHEGYRQTDRQNCDGKYPNVVVTSGKKRKA